MVLGERRWPVLTQSQFLFTLKSTECLGYSSKCLVKCSESCTAISLPGKHVLEWWKVISPNSWRVLSKERHPNDKSPLVFLLTQFAFPAPWWNWIQNSNRNTPGCRPAWKGARLPSTSILWKPWTPVLLTILQLLGCGFSRCLLLGFSTASSPVKIRLCFLCTPNLKRNT